MTTSPPAVTDSDSPHSAQTVMPDQTAAPPVPSVEVADEQPTKRPPLNPREWAVRILMVLFVVAISIGVFAFSDRAAELQQYGLFGIFVLNILANATIVLPAPAIAIVFTMGAVFNPFWVGIAAGAGATIGELSGYMIGFSGQTVIENVRLYDRVVEYTRRYGMWLILVLAFIPNPFFDIAGIAAGALKLKLHRFLIFTFVGKLLRMWLVAYAGAYSIDWIMSLFGG